MRTTVRLDDDLLRQAKATAAQQGQTLTQLIEDALRLSLSKTPTPEIPPVDLPTFSGKLMPGVNLDSYAELLDFLDEPEGDVYH
jgi:hypothetical protein